MLRVRLSWRANKVIPPSDGRSGELQPDGSYHYSFYERGRLGFERVGSIDDLRYWYCADIVTDEAAKQVDDRAERFKLEYEILCEFSSEWAKRNVRETAAMLRRQPQDIALLPDIGEPL